MKFLKKIWNWITGAPTRPKDSSGDSLTVKFENAGSVTLNVDVDLTKASKIDRDFVSELIDKMQKHSRA